MLFKFEYDGDIVLEGSSVSMTAKATGISSVDMATWDDNESRFGYGFVTPPHTDTSFIRIPTDLTLDDSGIGVMLESKHHGIRIRMRNVLVGGTIHRTRIDLFQKILYDEHDEPVYQNMWTTGVALESDWDTSSAQAMFLAIYEGYGDFGAYGDDIPCIAMQLQILDNGQMGYASGTCFWQENLFNPAPEPEETYPPTGGNIQIGGTGDGFYPSDPAERPDIANLNAILSFGSSDGKGLTYYSVHSFAEIYEVFGKIYSNSFINLETRLKAMVDAFRIPFANTESGAVGQQMTVIPVADVDVHLVSAFGMYPILKRYVQVNFGVLDMTQYGWDDWNDFSNTKATLYLPFHGRINVDVNAFIRGSIEIIAVCDTYTGNITYWVYTKPMQAEREYLYGVYEGQSAVQIPIASTYTPNLMGKIMSSAGALGAGIIAGGTGHYVTAAGLMFGAGKMAADAMQQNVDTSHMLDSASNATSPLHVRLDISRREMLRPEQYREIASIPAFVTERFGDLEGLVRVHSADYDGLRCEQSEKEIIKQMLEDGVYV